MSLSFDTIFEGVYEIDLFLGCGVSNHHVRASCSLTDSQIHGLIKTGRFFENPLVGRHVLNVRPKKGVNLGAVR